IRLCRPGRFIRNGVRRGCPGPESPGSNLHDRSFHLAYLQYSEDASECRMAVASDKQREVGAVVHAMRILRHLAATPSPQGVAAVARGTGISPSTCFGILRTMA